MNLLSITPYDEAISNAITMITSGAMTLGKKLIIAILLWIIGKKVIKWVEMLVSTAFDKGKLDVNVAKFVTSLVRIACFAILIITIVSVLGFETTSLITLIGSAGVTIGLALQGSLSNFAGGVLILIFRPFRMGDYIVACGQEGTVTGIDIMYTKLTTVDNKIITIPNGALANTNIVNVGAEPVRRVDLSLGISYGADIKKAKKVLEDVIAKEAKVLHDKEVVTFVEDLLDSSVKLQARCWCKTEDYWTVRWNLLENYKVALDENGVTIPFNQLDVFIKNK